MSSGKQSLLLVLALTVAVTVAGCGSDSSSDAANPFTGIKRTVPEATEESGETVRGPGDKTSMLTFLTSILQDVDDYWERTLEAAGLPLPYVNFNFPAPGEVVRTACKDASGNIADAGDDAAFYCPLDDTIYISQQFAWNLWVGFDGQVTVPGDFGVAYVLAHEYAHNIQTELGVYDLKLLTVNTELQADCLAGTWANSVYYKGQLDETDIPEAMSTASAVGDVDFSDPGHHGTPDQRSEAWKFGYDSGNPDACDKYYTPLQPGA